MDLHNQGREEEGIPLLNAAIGVHPYNARLWHVLGLLHRAAQDSAAAKSALQKAARLAPDDPKIAHAHAQVALEAGFPATHLFELARQRAPADGDILLGWIAAQSADGNTKQAIQDLEAVSCNNPLWLHGQTTLAQMKWRMGDKQGFTRGFAKALEAKGSYFPLWLELINVLVQNEMYAEADDATHQARSLAGDHAALDVCEAICASELGDVARADRLFAHLSPISTIPVAVRHLRHLLRTGRVEEAAKRAEPLVNHSDADQVWPYLLLAWRLLGDSRWVAIEGDDRLVGVYDISEGVDLGLLAGALRQMHNAAQPPLGQSVRGGTQTDGPLFTRIEPPIQLLRKAVADTIEKHITSLQALPQTHPLLEQRPRKVRFSGSWSVRLAGGEGHHTNHIHPQGWLSSAFYVTVPTQEQMGPAPAGWLALGEPPAELNLKLPPLRRVEPKPGRLVLFPSTMWHGTAPFEAGERLTVAFDVAGSS
jgi:tetratricopeptide (TPR) repeat protein